MNYSTLLLAQQSSDPEKEAKALKPLFNRVRKTKHESQEVSFFRRIAFGATECWHWVGNRNTHGYGVMPNTTLAHRFSFELFKGAIPQGCIVMHSCDNRACVNPDHLTAASQSDNVRDMESKGRANHQSAKGINNPKAKLSPEAAHEIRLSRLPTIALAKIHGVSRSTILRIKNNESWN